MHSADNASENLTSENVMVNLKVAWFDFDHYILLSTFIRGPPVVHFGAHDINQLKNK